MSSARSESSLVSAPLSLAVHAGLIVLAIRATATRHVPPPMVGHITWPVLIAPAPQSAQPVIRGTGGGGAPVVSAPVLDPIAVGDIPSTLPAVALTGLTAPPPIPGSTLATDVPGIPSMLSEELRGPTVLHIDTPVYPTGAPARQAGAVDSVVVEYQVGVQGEVRLEGIRMVGATDQIFAREVERVLLRARFTPAMHGGVAVPVLVRQQFRFVRP